MPQTQSWFDVDKEGLAKIIRRKGLSFILYELLQNAWDQNVKTVNVTMSPIAGKHQVLLRVEDDDPEGFADLSHAFTLFAESTKKSDPSKRGRFNFGEKLVLAMCESAFILSTKGMITFGKKGRTKCKQKRDSGTMFSANLKITRDEMREMIESAKNILPPKGIKTTINGEIIEYRKPFLTFSEKMPTEIADEEGNLKKSQRKTKIEIHPGPDENHTIFEMGIPVVETDIGFGINVMQKIPLNMDRDNITPAYAARLKAIVLNHMNMAMDKKDMAESWVSEALEHPECSVNAAKKVIEARYGDKAAVNDPTDPESKNRATAKGFAVIHGRSFSKAAWENLRKFDIVQSTSQVAPTPKPFHPGGRPLVIIPEYEYDEMMKYAKVFAVAFANNVICRNVIIKFTYDKKWEFDAVYSKGKTVEDRDLTINLDGVLLKKRADVNFISLLIHEFAHEYEGNHLTDDYHKACCDVGARWGIMKEKILEEAEEEFDIIKRNKGTKNANTDSRRHAGAV